MITSNQSGGSGSSGQDIPLEGEVETGMQQTMAMAEQALTIVKPVLEKARPVHVIGLGVAMLLAGSAWAYTESSKKRR